MLSVPKGGGVVCSSPGRLLLRVRCGFSCAPLLFVWQAMPALCTTAMCAQYMPQSKPLMPPYGRCMPFLRRQRPSAAQQHSSKVHAHHKHPHRRGACMCCERRSPCIAQCCRDSGRAYGCSRGTPLFCCARWQRTVSCAVRCSPHSDSA